MDSMIWPDDNLRLICHQDFDRYLLLAMQVKEITDAIARGSLVSPTEFLESTDHEAACKLGKTIKMAQLPPGVGMPPTLVRGKFPWIDALMEHNLATLSARLEQLHQYHATGKDDLEKRSVEQADRRNSSISIAQKHPFHQSSYLTEWLADCESPFPSAEEVEQLSLGCGLSENQINNWVTNSRKRHHHAVINNKKRPAAFLDYAFLASQRQKWHCYQSETKSKTSISLPVNSRNPKDTDADADAEAIGIVDQPSLRKNSATPLKISGRTQGTIPHASERHSCAQMETSTNTHDDSSMARLGMRTGPLKDPHTRRLSALAAARIGANCKSPPPYVDYCSRNEFVSTDVERDQENRRLYDTETKTVAETHRQSLLDAFVAGSSSFDYRIHHLVDAAQVIHETHPHEYRAFFLVLGEARAVAETSPSAASALLGRAESILREARGTQKNQAFNSKVGFILISGIPPLPGSPKNGSFHPDQIHSTAPESPGHDSDRSADPTVVTPSKVMSTERFLLHHDDRRPIVSLTFSNDDEHDGIESNANCGGNSDFELFSEQQLADDMLFQVSGTNQSDATDFHATFGDQCQTVAIDGQRRDR